MLLAGLCLMVPALVLMTLFDDDRALAHRGLQSPARPQQQPEGAVATAPATAAAAADGHEDCGSAAEQHPLMAQKGAVAAVGEAGGHCWHRSVVATALIGFSDLFGALASGMTVRFFAGVRKLKFTWHARQGVCVSPFACPNLA